MRSRVAECQRIKHEEGYDEAFTLADILQQHLTHYEQALQQHDVCLPYDVPIEQRRVRYENHTS